MAEVLKCIVNNLIADKNKFAPNDDKQHYTNFSEEMKNSSDKNQMKKCLILPSGDIALILAVVACGVTIASILIKL